MTKQIHKYVCMDEKFRKECTRGLSGHRRFCHTRNWWKAWHRRYKNEANEMDDLYLEDYLKEDTYESNNSIK